MAAQLLINMSKHERFHTPGTLDLNHNVLLDSITPLTDAQLLAMTLNEICVLRGKGQFFWIQEYETRLICLADLIYCGRPWTENEKNIFWNKSQIQRFEDSSTDILREPDTQPTLPNPTVTPVTVRVFPITTDYDVISWPETTLSNLILCYRDGAAYLDNLDTWEPYAEKAALRTFATGTQPSEPGAVISTPSYVVYWRHLPALQLARQRLLDNEKVVQAVDMVWMDMAFDPGAPRLLWGSGPGCVPVM